MESAPLVTDVLAAKERIRTLQVAVANSFFLWTWSASYVRLVEVAAAAMTTLPVVLAYALWNDPSDPEFSPDEWLPNISFERRDLSAVKQLVEHALSDIEEAGCGQEHLAQRLRGLTFREPCAIYELIGTPGGPRPAAPRRYGPTYQITWQTEGRFFFLEVHNES